MNAPCPLAGLGLDLAVYQHRRVYVLRRVRAGATVGQAAAEAGVTRGAVLMWRRRVPGFAADLDRAKRMAQGREKAVDPRKAQVLALVDRGLSFGAAARSIGLGHQAPNEWAKRDPEWAAEYRRRLGPTKKSAMRRRIPVLLDLLRSGKSLPAACRVAGIEDTAVYRWRRTHAELWRQVEEARAVGGGGRRMVRASGERIGI